MMEGKSSGKRGARLGKAVIGLERYFPIVVAIPQEPAMLHLSVR
jgi:hypothetical protein